MISASVVKIIAAMEAEFSIARRVYLGRIGNTRFDHVAVFAVHDVETYPMVAALRLRAADVTDDDRAIFADVRGRVGSEGVGQWQSAGPYAFAASIKLLGRKAIQRRP